MTLPTKSIWLAVHRIFDDANIKIGETLSLQELMVAWGQIGLRQQDLAGALDTLVRTGHLQLEMSEQGPCARLVSEAFGSLREDGRDHAALLSLERLRAARSRPAHVAASLIAAGDKRRRDDRKPG